MMLLDECFILNDIEISTRTTPNSASKQSNTIKHLSIAVPFRVLKLLVKLRCGDDQGGGYHSFEEKQEDIKMKENMIIETNPPHLLEVFHRVLVNGSDNEANVTQSLISPNDVKELREEKIIFNTLGSDEEVVQVYKGLKPYGADDPLLFKNVKRNIQEHYNSKGKTWIAGLIDTYFNSPWSLTASIVTNNNRDTQCNFISGVYCS
ncbi:hypothetical protein KY284_012641 [Solanum tuberosum]|nr:hypothetical protein KY284_012641 [Solanum tuberosum]